jgi:ATP-dependent Clp protease ATP-binding subunit ClpB
MLKPALARGELSCVGATTIDEYRRVEKDAALARRFQSVLVEEPSVPDTVAMLRGLRERYETHHGITIRDSAVVAAAVNAARYISERRLPDSAIDLIDEAASRLKMAQQSKPEVLESLERELMRLRVEAEALRREGDAVATRRKAEIEREIATGAVDAAQMEQRWEKEKGRLEDTKAAKAELEVARKQLEAAMRDGDLGKAGELQYETIPRLEELVGADEEALETAGVGGARGGETSTMVAEAVTETDVLEVVARATGIPVQRLKAADKHKLLELEATLRRRVIGQEEALATVASAVRLARAGLQSGQRPVGSFLFLGPTGVGKTELCKATAEALFDSERHVTRIDMSEYMERHSVARLIGAPPGYVGYEAGGQLTEAVRRRPYQLVLFDEVEKAHKEVLNVLLQVLDEGHLTDGQGRRVDFSNCLVVLTSNLGSEAIASASSAGLGAPPFPELPPINSFTGFEEERAHDAAAHHMRTPVCLPRV